MERQLSLIKNHLGGHEKRLLPRFPYSAMTFRRPQDVHVYEVKDITSSGMQLGLKGPIPCQRKEVIEGHIHWHGEDLALSAQVEWVAKERMGVSFLLAGNKAEELAKFISPASVARHLRPLHKMDLFMDLPVHLKHWVRADGPHEIFMWCHTDGEFSRIQCIVREHFWEWEDGGVAKTGRLVSKRDMDTPLMTEDEFIFLMDPEYKVERAKHITELLGHLTEEHLPQSSLDFLKRLT